MEMGRLFYSTQLMWTSHSLLGPSIRNSTGKGGSLADDFGKAEALKTAWSSNICRGLRPRAGRLGLCCLPGHTLATLSSGTKEASFSHHLYTATRFYMGRAWFVLGDVWPMSSIGVPMDLHAHCQPEKAPGVSHLAAALMLCSIKLYRFYHLLRPGLGTNARPNERWVQNIEGPCPRGNVCGIGLALPPCSGAGSGLTRPCTLLDHPPMQTMEVWRLLYSGFSLRPPGCGHSLGEQLSGPQLSPPC